MNDENVFTIQTMLVKWISFFVILSLILGFQQSSFSKFIGDDSSQVSHDHHEDFKTSFLEVLEILITGSLAHSHEHGESGRETHEHPHEHHFSGAAAGLVFILAQVFFSSPATDLVWFSDEAWPDLNPYYTEILKPPISA